MNATECHITVIPFGEQRQPYELQSLLDCLAIREQVFIEEQKVPMSIEQDGKDNESGHLLLWNQDLPVGTLRFRETPEGIKLERIAILKEYRGQHLGKLLIREGIRAARMVGTTAPIYLHSQEQASNFYASIGFKETAEHTIEAGIPHVTMSISEENENWLLDTDTHELSCDF